MGWNKERLVNVARTRLGGAKLIVVANREPYIHRYNKLLAMPRASGTLFFPLGASLLGAIASGTML